MKIKKDRKRLVKPISFFSIILHRRYDIMDKFIEVKSICSKCGGRCCKRNPGVYKGGEVSDFKGRIGSDYGIVIDLIMNPDIASQFIPNFNSMSESMKKIAYDNWNLLVVNGLASEDDFVSFLLALRPMGKSDYCAIVGTKFIQLGNVSGNACIFLTDKGCKMSLKDRPYECKVLEPHSNFVCGHGNRYGYLGVDVASSWIPYQRDLQECFMTYCESLDADTVNNLRNQGDDLFNAIIDEQFLGIVVTEDGVLTFNK